MNSDAHKVTFAQYVAELADRGVTLSKTEQETCEQDFQAGHAHGYPAGYAAGFAAGRAAALGCG